MRSKKLALLVITGCVGLSGIAASQAIADTVVGDNGFELPNQGSLSYTAKYQYNPTGTAWTFTGQTGVASNGSGFGVYNATNGNSDGTTSDLGQAGFIQNGNGALSGDGSSSISQILTLSSGSYNLNFDAEGRGYGGGSNPITVYLYDASLTQSYLKSNVTPVSTLGLSAAMTVFSPYSDSFSVPTTGQYALYFVGNGVASQDVTSFIDNVNVTTGSLGQPPTFATPMPTAAWAGVSLMGGLYLMALRRRRNSMY